ncbi:hypothetical protein [Alteribacillus sp. YIM 98480]|uniref:hypothetical protein n=1 Tax=Alteribacillus sp. YIM 98480 TaxID=2606599 RepID=UPI00131AF268|nr:hypothetical protein [Alteribacillus sp. YIM 98480]
MLVAGYGKLVKMIITLNQQQQVFNIYNRTAEKVHAAARKDERIQYCSPEHFHRFTNVFLALPPEGCISFLRKFAHLFQSNTVIFHTATNLYANKLKETVPYHHIIPAKFAGHANQAVRDKSGGTFVVPDNVKKERTTLESWLGDAFNVKVGTEDMVKTANQIAVEETMKLAVQLEERLEKAGVSKPIQKAVFAQIPAGVLHAHLEGTHGAFARQVLKQMEHRKGDEENENR